MGKKLRQASAMQCEEATPWTWQNSAGRGRCFGCCVFADECTDTWRRRDHPWQQWHRCLFRIWIVYVRRLSAILEQWCVGCGNQSQLKKTFQGFFFLVVYLTFDKQIDCHSNMCILLNKYLCKYHRRKGVISLCWFTFLQKQINTFYCILFFF